MNYEIDQAKRIAKIQTYENHIKELESKKEKLYTKTFNKVVEKSIIAVNKKIDKKQIYINDITARIKIAEDNKKIKEEERLTKRRIKSLKFKKEFSDIIKLLNDDIKKNLDEGFSVEDISASAFFNIRNSPYELSKGSEFLINLPHRGNVQEHVNGRTAFGIYCAMAVATGEIENPEELMDFYKKYCCYIKTDAEFNENVIKKLQNGEGAIKSSIYIAEYEKYFNVKLTDDEKEYFSSKFLYDDYGVITKEQLIKYVRDNF